MLANRRSAREPSRPTSAKWSKPAGRIFASPRAAKAANASRASRVDPAKENPRHQDQMESHDHADQAAEPISLAKSQPPPGRFPGGASEIAADDVTPVQKTPRDESPTRAVPQPAQDENDENVPVKLGRAAPVAAERNVNVIPEPGRKRDVPAPPKIRDGAGEIRHIEIPHQLVSHCTRGSAGDIGVTGKIAVDLNRKGIDRDPHRQSSMILRMCKRRSNNSREVVRDHHFFEQTPGD